MNNFFDKIDEIAKNKSPYSADEIEKARKLAKKSGKTFLEVLQESSGKSLNSASLSSPSLEAKKTPSSEDLITSATKDIEELNQHLEADFGIMPKGDAETFDGVEDVLTGKVFGQNDFLKKLAVAFKRPFILPEEKNHPRNSFYIYGPKGSGKHYSLNLMTAELHKRKILSSGEVYLMDLSRYTASGKDNVFLQDLYAALQAEANVILFENFQDCHISYLTYLSDLVIKGECYLQDRYMLQQGQLINASNAFTKMTVSTFHAAGKYLVFMGNKNVEELANVFGAPFVNTLGDFCATEALTEESWKKIAKVEWDKLVETSKKQFAFLVSTDEEALFTTALSYTQKNAGTKGLLSFFDTLLKSLATVKLEGSYPKDCKVTLSMEGNSILAKIGEDSLNLLDNLPSAYTGDITAVKADLDNIVGLTKIKEYILSLEEYYNIQQKRMDAGLKTSDVSKHMIFTGNPGTGKTTIARIISRYLKAIGVLSGGQLVEVSRADLVGRFVGHTAPLVNQVIKSALGGVLFIDEAYSLYRGQEDSFGLEAIDTLVKGIEDNRDNLIVILAGYSDEMEEFLEANSGLKSRFPNIINFPDYTGGELLSITKIIVKSKGYVLAEEAESALLDYYNKIQATCPDTAGNGRLVRNKVEEAILNQSRRLVAEPDADLSILQLNDFNLDYIE